MRLKPQVPLTLDWFKLKLDEETLLVLIESECFLPSESENALLIKHSVCGVYR